jgi:hypothetical protein
VPHALCSADSAGLPAPQPTAARCLQQGRSQPWP